MKFLMIYLRLVTMKKLINQNVFLDLTMKRKNQKEYCTYRTLYTVC